MLQNEAERMVPVEPAGPAWGWNDVLLALLVMVGATALLALGVRSAAAALGVQLEQRLVSPALYLLGLGAYLAAVLGVYLFAARRAGWRALGLRATGWPNILIVPPLFVLELLLIVVVNGAVALLAGGFDNPQVDSLTGGVALSTGELVALLVLVAVVAPFAEELFFRGMLYPLLRARMGAAPAIVFNAALFAVAHVVVVLIPALFVVGLLLAYLRERSGSLWPSLLLHGMQNATALLLINIALSTGQV